MLWKLSDFLEALGIDSDKWESERELIGKSAKLTAVKEKEKDEKGKDTGKERTIYKYQKV